jgi:hypothetical protein
MAEIDVETAHIYDESRRFTAFGTSARSLKLGVHAVIFVVSIRSADQVTSSSLQINWLAGCGRLLYCLDDPDIF